MNFGSLLNLLSALAYNRNGETDNSIAIGPGYNLDDGTIEPRANSTFIIEFGKFIPSGAPDDNQQKVESNDISNDDVNDITQIFKLDDDVEPDFFENNERFIDLTQLWQPNMGNQPAGDESTIEFVQPKLIDEKPTFNHSLDLTTILNRAGKPLTDENNENTAIALKPESCESPAKVEAIQLTQREKSVKSSLEEVLES